MRPLVHEPGVERFEPVKLEHSNVTVLRVHSFADCEMLDADLPCPAHNRTDHPMRGWPQAWTQDRFGRVCEHGVTHPDPDDVTVVHHDCACGCCAVVD